VDRDGESICLGGRQGAAGVRFDCCAELDSLRTAELDPLRTAELGPLRNPELGPVRTAEQPMRAEFAGGMRKGRDLDGVAPSVVPSTNSYLVSRFRSPQRIEFRRPQRVELYQDLSIDVPKLYLSPTAKLVVNPVPLRYQSDAPWVGMSDTCANGAQRL
jgi:hypothetical protein